MQKIIRRFIKKFKEKSGLKIVNNPVNYEATLNI